MIAIKIRYIMDFEGNQFKSVYSIENLENLDLIHMMDYLNEDVTIRRRDYSTEMTDLEGNEIFENDKVLMKGGVMGYVTRKPGGFYVNDTPLGELTIIKVLED